MYDKDHVKAKNITTSLQVLDQCNYINKTNIVIHVVDSLVYILLGNYYNINKRT